MPTYLRYFIIAAGALLLFIPFLGQVHLFDWDEINFAECAREMIVSKDYLRMQIDYRPFFEKPPLFIWLQVLSMKLFGINEFAARFPNALVGITTLLSIFYIGRKTVNEKMATWWVVLYAATWLPHFYFKTGIIDPLFNLFIFLAFFQVHCLRFSRSKPMHVLLAGLFIGLAVLTKGPVAIVVSLLSLGVYFILNRGLQPYTILQLLGIAGTGLLVTLCWFGVEIAQHGFTFIQEFLSYQASLFGQNVADHAEPWYYHPVVLLIGCFPTSALLFQFTRRRLNEQQTAQDFTRWMWILFWVVLILFSIVKTKIVHYSSLCYYPMTFLAALQLYRLGERQVSLKKGVKALLLFLGTVWSIVLIALPLVGLNKDKLIPLIQDPFAVANLRADVHWSAWECLIGLFYLAAIWAGILMMRRDFAKGMRILAITQVLAIQVTMLHFTPKIEAYSQRAAITFYESKKGQPVYVHVLGFRSYANLFYTQKQPAQSPPQYTEKWLLNGHIDKPAFFVCKIQDAEQYRRHPLLKTLYEQNGFVFFERLPNKPNGLPL